MLPVGAPCNRTLRLTLVHQQMSGVVYSLGVTAAGFLYLCDALLKMSVADPGRHRALSSALPPAGPLQQPNNIFSRSHCRRRMANEIISLVIHVSSTIIVNVDVAIQNFLQRYSRR